MSVLTFTQFLTETQGGELGNAKGIIRALRNAGFQAYLVGGCVRDTLLGRTPKDYDVATDAHPDQVLRTLDVKEAKLVGEHFGVVICHGIEIATFRSDGAYGDGRHPDSVKYEKSFRDDAARRDFTVNAMAMDPFSGHVVDYFGGQEDIKKKVLRAVGDPYKRFGEDHIRMLRAMRFAAKLGFTIDPDTLAAMKGLAPKIKSVAPERVTQEISGAVSFPGGPLKSFTILKDTGMLEHIFPEIHALSPHQHGVLETILHQAHSESHTFVLAALFSELHSVVVPAIAKRLKLSNEEQAHINAILGMQTRIGAVNEHLTLDTLKKLMREKFFPDALKLYGMRVKAHDNLPAHPFEFLTKFFAGMKQEDLHPEKFVTGDDLIAMGLHPGKRFKEILDHIENAQLRGEVHSKDQGLSLARSMR